jgi:foldase protein PrsA
VFDLKKIKTLVMSVVLGMSLIGCSSTAKVDPQEVVATINGKEITAQYYQKMLALYKDSIENLYGDAIWDQEVEDGVVYRDKFKEIVLQQIIDSEAIYTKAEELNLLPSDEEVDASYTELMETLEADEEYLKTLESAGIDEEFLKEQTKSDLAWQNYQEYFLEATIVPDEEIEAYYEENIDSYYVDEAKASHILISTVDENGDSLSEDKKLDALKQAQAVLYMANSGEEFALLAQQYSQDEASAESGGDLGYFEKGDMVSEFEDAAFALEIGEISDIVESEYGYHIIKLTDRVEEQTTLDDNKESIRQILLEEKYVEEIENLSQNAVVETKQDIINNIKF